MKADLNRTFAQVLGTPGYDQWLYDYCGETATVEGAAKYFQHLRDILDFAGFDPHGKDVLDVGCGFGFTLIALAEMGAKTCRGIDVADVMVETVKAYLPSITHSIEVEIGDAAKLPYPDASMDLILSVEAISHYRDVPGFVHEAYRVLRPNGVVVVLDTNNAMNPRIRRANQIVWNAYEQGTSDGKLGGRELPKPFVERRREWIAEHYPELPAGRLAEATYGYDFRELVTVLPDWPEPRSGTPVNPEDGAFLERMWNPFQLAREFREARFSTRVRGYWGGASGRSLIRFADRVLASTPLTMPLARGFRLAATRR